MHGQNNNMLCKNVFPPGPGVCKWIHYQFLYCVCDILLLLRGVHWLCGTHQLHQKKALFSNFMGKIPKSVVIKLLVKIINESFFK